MRILRFVFPFLFVRNWYDGSFEFSKARCVIFCASLALLLIGAVIAYMLQAPVLYSTNEIS